MSSPAPPPEPLLTVAEVAAVLRVAPGTVREAIRRRELRAVRVRNLLRVPEPALVAYLRRFGQGGR